MNFRQIIPIIIIIAFYGCQAGQNKYDETAVAPHVIYASMEDVDTRTSLGEDKLPVWSRGDEVVLFTDDRYGARYEVSDESAGTPSGSFVLKEDADRGPELGADILFYPYSENAACVRSEKDFRLSGISFPDRQTFTSGSFAENSMPMAALADSDSENFVFRNLGGVMEISMTGTETISSITLSGNDGEYLSGPAVAILSSDGVPQVEMSSQGASDTVVLECGDSGIALSPDTPTSFMIALPPVVFEKGFSLKIRDVNGGEMHKETSKGNEVCRSGILRMPTFGYVADFMNPSVEIKALSKTFEDIRIHVKVSNVEQYSGGYVEKDAFSLAKIVRDSNWKNVPRITDSFEYEGSLSGFPSGGYTQLSGGRTYIVWVAPYAKGQKLVTEDDIVYQEFTMPDTEPGGSLQVMAVSEEIDHKSMGIGLSADGAVFIYGALLTEDEMAGLDSNESMVEYLFNTADPVRGDECLVVRDGLVSGQRVYVLAVAIDSDGKYGDILKSEYTTREFVFDEDMELNLSVSYDYKKALVKVEPQGGTAVRYYWFCDKSDSSVWMKYFGGTLASAEVYMSENLDSHYIETVEVTGQKDACIVVDDIEKDEDYVFVVIAENASGEYSHAFMLGFVDHLDLGSFVSRSGSQSSLWRAMKPEIKFGECRKDVIFYTINWMVNTVEGTTAYSACMHPDMTVGCTPQELAVLIYNQGTEVVPGKMETMFYGDKANLIYVTWCDSDGNFYEPYGEKVP